VRDMDTVARFGGDEFVLLLTDLSEDAEVAQTQAARLAEKARLALAEPYVLSAERQGRVSTVQHRCTASVGVRLFSAAEGEHAEEALLDEADAAMYEAKDAGCNTVRFQGPALV
jgi:diguanylate cyclase (GGDEF)-like protein